MAEDNEACEPALKPDHRYVAHYRTHLTQVQDHLSGSERHTLAHSYVPPTGYWSPEEKNAFFHGLSVYSRLRPDLIAECIKTKTVVDVCAYIDILKDAESRQPKKSVRNELSIAAEVSEEWIDLEEDMASALAAVEPEWEEEVVKRARESQVQAVVRRTRKAVPRGEKPRRSEVKQLRQEYQTQWDLEDTLRSLDSAHLIVMDRLLREDEEGLLAGPLDMKESSTTPIHAVDDETIDPALRAESLQNIVSVPQKPSTPSASPASIQASTSDVCPVVPVHPDHTDEPLIPSTPTQDMAILPLPNTAPIPSAISAPLSPASRRRLQKRLYMRRKRAQLTGSLISTEVGRLKPGRKSKERNKTRKKGGGRAGAEGMQIDDVNDVITAGVDGAVGKSNGPGSTLPTKAEVRRSPSEGDEEEDTRHPHIGGTTLPYKIKARFEEADITVETLIQNNLDLFHLSTLGNLMRMYGMVHDVPSSSVGSQISAEAIRFLHAHVVHFVTELVHRTIVSREQERKLKVHTKVWRISEDQIVAANVEHGLEIMGVGKVGKKAHFAGLLERFGLDGIKSKSHDLIDRNVEESADEDIEDSDCEGSGAQEAEEDDDADDIDADDEGEFSSPLPALRLHQQIYSPFIRPPSYLHSASSPHAKYPPTSQPHSEDSLIPLETDEGLLVAELAEDERLDAKDKAVSKVHEEKLWQEFAPEGEATGVVEDIDAHYFRLCEPDVNGPVKSQPYIYDSD